MLMTEVQFLIIKYLFYLFSIQIEENKFCASAVSADPAVTTVSAKLCLLRASGGVHIGWAPAFKDS